MPGFIEEFYYGNIEPQESNKEFKAVLKKKLDSLTETEKELSEKLPNEEQELLARYVEKNLDFLTTSVVDSFVKGFRVGAKFVLDTFKWQKHLIFMYVFCLRTVAEAYVDTGVKILIAVVIGALLLTLLYALFNDVQS